MSKASELVEKYKVEEVVPNSELILLFMDLMNFTFHRKRRMKKPEVKSLLSSLDSTSMKKLEKFLGVILSGIDIPKQKEEPEEE